MIADLYIRVSTDEQADKGYSQRNQEEVLRKYCEINGITVRKVVYEDHSAKTFNRPAWAKLLAFLKKNRNKSDLVLFTKWDRFSRNASDAYLMISTLKGLGIEPQAVEQPLDMTVPENKMMLAIYLTAPEIENDRRALNVFYGMRRARKEGRFMASAPVGYVNHTLEGGLKRIVPKEPQASIIRWAFKEIRKGRYSTEQIWKRAREKGLSCGKNAFLVVVRNPVYCGRIVVPKYKDEEKHTVPGIHEPLISETLFYEVQDVLDGRKRVFNTTITSMAKIPLKGFLGCSRCERILTGSASKGRSDYYHYYHCSSACGYRKKAEEVNSVFVEQLSEYALSEKAAEIFKAVILDVYSDTTQYRRDSRRQYIKQITDLNNKLTKARELLLNGDIDPADYKTIKTDTEHEIEVLEAKLSEEDGKVAKLADIEPIVDSAIETLAQIHVMYCKSDTEKKRRIIGSIYPKKFTFEEIKDRTAEVKDVFKFTYLINKELGSKKRRANPENLDLPAWVLPPGLEPGTKRL